MDSNYDDDDDDCTCCCNDDDYAFEINVVSTSSTRRPETKNPKPYNHA